MIFYDFLHFPKAENFQNEKSRALKIAKTALFELSYPPNESIPRKMKSESGRKIFHTLGLMVGHSVENTEFLCLSDFT